MRWLISSAKWVGNKVVGGVKKVHRQFKLEKLRIEAYKDPERTEKVIDAAGKGIEFEAMFNPESLTRKIENIYAKYNVIGVEERKYFSRTKIPEISLKLIIDGTGLHQPGYFEIVEGVTSTFVGIDVTEKVTQFIDLCCKINGESHRPNYLKLLWGKENFACSLASVDIKYTNFGRDGKPFRAELDIKLFSEVKLDDLLSTLRLSSPDVTHSRIVKAGDTLPLLTKEIYGSSDYYLWVAEQNGLDNINTLVPGQRLVFPPLESAASR